MRFIYPALSVLFLHACAGAPAFPPGAPAFTPVPSAEVPGSRAPAGARLDASGYLFDPLDRSCDGFPRLNVETMPGTCLGLVLSPGQFAKGVKPWAMPRTLAQIPGSEDFLAVDMGGWADQRGALYWLKKNNAGRYEAALVKSGLNLPHGLVFGPGEFFYLGEKDQITRFRFNRGAVQGWQVVVSGLPRFKGYMHPLVAFAFDPRNNDLYVNSGAPSDHCFVKEERNYRSCPEDQAQGLAAIFRFPGDQVLSPPPGGLKNWEVAAQGLRNSMALAVHPSGYLLQGENGQDFPELGEPYEELNYLELSDAGRGRHFGWPYCYDFHAVSPDWKSLPPESLPVRCADRGSAEPGNYQPPWILLPPHSAPLHMAYYPAEGMLTSLLAGKLLVSWHGYQPPGHRLVAYAVDGRGLPVPSAAASASYSFDVKNSCAASKPYQAQGGMDRVAGYSEVIYGWDERKGVRPKGAPTGFTVAGDGSIWILEDKNRTLLRLARDNRPAAAKCEAHPDEQVDPRLENLAWRGFLRSQPGPLKGYDGLRSALQTYCSACHGGFRDTAVADDHFSELDYLVNNDLFQPGNSLASKLYQVLARTGEMRAMPPEGMPQPPEAERQSLAQSVKQWIGSLPADLSRSYKKVQIGPPVGFKDAPKLGGRDCGAYRTGDFAYIDPRPAARTTADGFQWIRIWVLPDDKGLAPGGCPYPEDGVFYMPIKKLK